MKKIFFIFLIVSQPIILFAQKNITANFYVVDSLFTEPISDVKIQIDQSVIFTNNQGRASLMVKPGLYEVRIFSEGYEKNFKNLSLKKDTLIFIIINKKLHDLNEIGIYAKRNEISLQANKYSLSGNFLSKASLPLSTNDPVHVLKLLPGISSTQEMNSNINLRGSSSYGTCLFLDDIPLPNYSHSFGLFSLYDSKTLRGIDYYSSQISSVYGFRGAGYIQFLTHDPYINKSTADISISPFLTSININSKIVPKKVGLFVHYRKSMFNKEYNKQIPLFSDFDDVLAKLKIALGKKSNLYVTYFSAKDQNQTNYGFGLLTSDSSSWKINSISLKHESTTNKGILINTSFFYNTSKISKFNNFNTDFTGSAEEINYKQTFILASKSNLKYLIGYEFSNMQQRNKLANGAINLLPGITEANILSAYSDLKLNFKNTDFYWNVRPSYYSPMKKVYLESRSGISKKINKNFFFFEFNNFVQFKHILSNNLLPIPQDFQFLSDTKFKPVTTKELLGGINRKSNRLELKTNIYYRIFQNAIDYKHLYSENLNSQFNISNVKQYSYGMENSFNLKINKRNSLFLAYTYSRVFVQNDSANNALWYPANYDRPHILNLLYTFKFKKFDFTSNFTVQSGRPVTVPIYLAFGNAPFYSNRNAERLPYYHRLDIGFNYNFKPKKHFQQTLQIHLYNAYGHKNVYGIVWDADKDTGAYKFFYLSVFPFLPSFNYTIQIR